MAELVCLSHQGIRCALPPRSVVAAGVLSSERSVAVLWPLAGESPTAPSSGEEQRGLEIITADGPCWIAASSVGLVVVASADVFPLPPVLQDFGVLPYLVGLALVGDELVWLVLPRRFHPQPGCVKSVPAEGVSLG